MQENDKSIKSYVIERTTGEVMDSIMEGDRIRITRKEKVEFLESTISIPFTSFAKLNTAEIAFLAKELSKPDFVFLLSLSDFVVITTTASKIGAAFPCPSKTSRRVWAFQGRRLIAVWND